MSRTFDQEVKAGAARIDALRQGLGLTQVGMAAIAGIPPTAMNAYCQGQRRISLNDAIRLCQRFGVTLDWLYFGDESGLPLRVVSILPRSGADGVGTANKRA